MICGAASSGWVFECGFCEGGGNGLGYGGGFVHGWLVGCSLVRCVGWCGVLRVGGFAGLI